MGRKRIPAIDQKRGSKASLVFLPPFPKVSRQWKRRTAVTYVGNLGPDGPVAEPPMTGRLHLVVPALHTIDGRGDPGPGGDDAPVVPEHLGEFLEGSPMDGYPDNHAIQPTNHPREKDRV